MHSMKRTLSAGKNSKSKGSSTGPARLSARGLRFFVCIRNTGYKASIELRKLYRAIPDSRAASLHFLRIVDETGEDYLYPEKYFLPLELTRLVKKALLGAS